MIQQPSDPYCTEDVGELVDDVEVAPWATVVTSFAEADQLERARLAHQLRTMARRLVHTEAMLALLLRLRREDLPADSPAGQEIAVGAELEADWAQRAAQLRNTIMHAGEPTNVPRPR
jgi:hypothetical protein